MRVVSLPRESCELAAGVLSLLCKLRETKKYLLLFHFWKIIFNLLILAREILFNELIYRICSQIFETTCLQSLFALV